MKFFIFNLAVIGALVYLILGDNQDLTKDINANKIRQSIIAPVKSAIKGAKEKFQANGEAPTVGEENLDQSKVSKITKNKSGIEQVNISREDAPALDANKIKQPLINVSKRPVPVMKKPSAIQKSAPFKEPLQQTIKKEPKSQFMTARERRRELNKLAGEMELLFVDKLNM